MVIIKKIIPEIIGYINEAGMDIAKRILEMIPFFCSFCRTEIRGEFFGMVLSTASSRK